MRSGGSTGRSIYDNPNLADLTLTRIDAEESEGAGTLEGRMRDYLDDLEQRNGTAYLELVAITLARVHFKALDDLARATGPDSTALLDAVEVGALEALLDSTGIRCCGGDYRRVEGSSVAETQKLLDA